MKKQKTILFVGAHPDDETLMGGTMIKLIENGWKAYIVSCTNGRNGALNRSEKSNKTMLANRKKEFELYAKTIGAEKPAMLNQKEIFLTKDPTAVMALVKMFRKTRPDVVVTHNGGDYHAEHIAAREITLDAFEHATRSGFSELGPKLASSILLEVDGLELLQSANITFDTSDTFAKKQKACTIAYKDRLGDLLEMDKGVSAFRGLRRKYKHAECFSVLFTRSYRMNKEAALALAEFIGIGE